MIGLLQCLTMQQFILLLISLFPLGIPASIHPQSIQRDLTYTYPSLCPSSIHFKVKEMNVSPGKIHSSSVYSPRALTAITSPGQIYAPLFFLPQFCFQFPFSRFLISGLVTGSK